VFSDQFISEQLSVISVISLSVISYQLSVIRKSFCFNKLVSVISIIYQFTLYTENFSLKLLTEN